MKPIAVLARILRALAVACVGLASLAQPLQAYAQSADPTPPAETVKLIFIHHSTGENWLTDGYGNLGQTLGENNYFVSDTNYGWGPDAIGDRTDIPNWPEWFRSERTPVYMQALFNENEQHASYTRSLADPGGENEIILFKSCFPNSALAGEPDDPPTPGYDLNVGNAKYIYNEILQYFATRPDKLFIVITAPPLSDPEYAANARAFNLWLRQNWLAENDYPYSNVAVFDFYNLLTDPEAHHRFAQGQIDYIQGNANTLYYPSGDDHPSEAGSQKATEEFIPLLNVFYHRWKAARQTAAPLPVAPEASPTAGPLEQPTETAIPQPMTKPPGMIDDFEGDVPSGSGGWSPNWDGATATSLTCAPEEGMAHGGSHALRDNFNVAAGSWSTCTLFYTTQQNWQAAQGLTFYLHTPQAVNFDVDVYAGTPDNAESYAFTLQVPPEAVSGWAKIFIGWGDLRRVEWEENAGTPLDPARVIGLGFGVSAPAEGALSGEMWIDDLQLTASSPVENGATAPEASAEATPESEIAPAVETGPATPQPSAERGKTTSPGICGAPAALLLATGMVVFWRRKARGVHPA